MLLIPLLVRLWKAFKDRNRQADDDGGRPNPAARR
jgi:hypothetical protein